MFIPIITTPLLIISLVCILLTPWIRIEPALVGIGIFFINVLIVVRALRDESLRRVEATVPLLALMYLLLSTVTLNIILSNNRHGTVPFFAYCYVPLILPTILLLGSNALAFHRQINIIAETKPKKTSRATRATRKRYLAAWRHRV